MYLKTTEEAMNSVDLQFTFETILISWQATIPTIFSPLKEVLESQLLEDLIEHPLSTEQPTIESQE